MNHITLDHVTYRYRDHLPPALDDVSVSFQTGERVCIIGANGSGKTTLVRYIAGLLPNRPSDEHNPEIAFLFQNPDNQMVAATVDKELAFGLENIAMPAPEIEQRIQREAAQFSIVSLLSRLTTELSGGEKQRVALASVLIAGPSVLILDEPDAYLDQPGRLILKAELERIHVQHPGLIEIRIALSTLTARQYPRVVFMVDGRIVADGPPDEVLDKWAAVPRRQFGYAPLVRDTAAKITSIEVTDLCATLGGRQVFSGLNLSLGTGRTTCVVGATGSGKSTLGHILAGLIKQSAGTISFRSPDGRPVDISRRSDVITSVLQNPERQFFLPTCTEEIAFGPRNFGVPISDSKINLMLQSINEDVDNFARRDPLTLSAGEKRRLAFSVALALGTPFVIFDEPTAGLDTFGIIGFIATVEGLVHSGRGLLVITHEASVVKEIADDVLVIEAGKASLYPKAEFLDHYPWPNLLSQDFSFA